MGQKESQEVVSKLTSFKQTPHFQSKAYNEFQNLQRSKVFKALDSNQYQCFQENPKHKNTTQVDMRSIQRFKKHQFVGIHSKAQFPLILFTSKGKDSGVFQESYDRVRSVMVVQNQVYVYRRNQLGQGMVLICSLKTRKVLKRIDFSTNLCVPIQRWSSREILFQKINFAFIVNTTNFERRTMFEGSSDFKFLQLFSFKKESAMAGISLRRGIMFIEKVLLLEVPISAIPATVYFKKDLVLDALQLNESLYILTVRNLKSEDVNIGLVNLHTKVEKLVLAKFKLLSNFYLEALLVGGNLKFGMLLVDRQHDEAYFADILAMNVKRLDVKLGTKCKTISIKYNIKKQRFEILQFQQLSCYEVGQFQKYLLQLKI